MPFSTQETKVLIITHSTFAGYASVVLKALKKYYIDDEKRRPVQDNNEFIMIEKTIEF